MALGVEHEPFAGANRADACGPGNGARLRYLVQALLGESRPLESSVVRKFRALTGGRHRSVQRRRLRIRLARGEELFGQILRLDRLRARDGEAGLRQLLTHPDGTREWLQDIACELQSAGLGKASAIVLELAANRPPAADLEAFCPYLKAPYAGQVGNNRNIEAWQRAEERRQSDAAHKRRRKKQGAAGITIAAP
jgi:hypothetical protein